VSEQAAPQFRRQFEGSKMLRLYLSASAGHSFHQLIGSSATDVTRYGHIIDWTNATEEIRTIKESFLCMRTAVVLSRQRSRVFGVKSEVRGCINTISYMHTDQRLLQKIRACSTDRIP